MLRLIIPRLKGAPFFGSLLFPVVEVTSFLFVLRVHCCCFFGSLHRSQPRESVERIARRRR